MSDERKQKLKDVRDMILITIGTWLIIGSVIWAFYEGVMK